METAWTFKYSNPNRIYKEENHKIYVYRDAIFEVTSSLWKDTIIYWTKSEVAQEDEQAEEILREEQLVEEDTSSVTGSHVEIETSSTTDTNDSLIVMTNFRVKLNLMIENHHQKGI